MSTLSFAQLEQLWTSNGGNPLAAAPMAAIALAESGGRTDATNLTGLDRSYGLWQINYYGNLAPGRTAAYGSPAQLLADPNAQAKAAISISSNGNNLRPWTTWTSGAAQKILNANGGSLGGLPALPSVAATSTSSPVATQDDEGDLVDLVMPSAIPNIKIARASVRRVAGGAVLVAGGVVGLAGVFVLVGAGNRLPGPLQTIRTVSRQRGQTERTRLTQEGLSQRASERSTRARRPKADVDELAARRRTREREAEVDIPTTGEPF